MDSVSQIRTHFRNRVSRNDASHAVSDDVERRVRVSVDNICDLIDQVLGSPVVPGDPPAGVKLGIDRRPLLDVGVIAPVA